MLLKASSSKSKLASTPSKPQKARVSRLFLGLMLTILLPTSWLVYRQVAGVFQQPEAILVLGGATYRESFAAEFAREHPDLPIWVSGGAPSKYTQGVFADAGVDLNRLHIDRSAADTVTNFTTLVDEFHAKGIDNIYVITSDYHMRRARVVGEIVLGSRGILLRPVPIPSEQAEPEHEPVIKTFRDAGRSVVWIVTGRTGASLSGKFEP